VLLSSAYPAHVASRVASPSRAVRWELPRPENDRMTTELPFTVGEQAARGVFAFLHEYFRHHTESSLGLFCTGWVRPMADARTGTRGLEAQVWLTPFDLGVMQTVRVWVEPSSEPDLYQVRLEVRRESGTVSAWRRTNKAFFQEIRKQFLLWRALAPTQVDHYITASDALYGQERSPSVDRHPPATPASPVNG